MVFRRPSVNKLTFFIPVHHARGSLKDDVCYFLRLIRCVLCQQAVALYAATTKGRLKTSFQTAFESAECYSPAAALKADTLSVRSQVNSGSSRPKWP